MSKVAIILDEPNSCSECQFCKNIEDNKYCNVSSNTDNENRFRAINDDICGSYRPN